MATEPLPNPKAPECLTQTYLYDTHRALTRNQQHSNAYAKPTCTTTTEPELDHTRTPDPNLPVRRPQSPYPNPTTPERVTQTYLYDGHRALTRNRQHPNA